MKKSFRGIINTIGLDTFFTNICRVAIVLFIVACNHNDKQVIYSNAQSSINSSADSTITDVSEYQDTTKMKKYQYQKKAYGVWGIQPGVDETFIYEGIDIREYADNLESFQSQNPDFIYENADEMAAFPGGIKAYKEYCMKRIKESLLLDSDVKGNDSRVIVEAVIEKDGSITHVKIAKSIDKRHDEDALRVVREMPKWIPAKHNGKHVRCRLLMPISFIKQQ